MLLWCEVENITHERELGQGQFKQMAALITLTLLHSERPKLNTVLAFLSAIGFIMLDFTEKNILLCLLHTILY